MFIIRTFYFLIGCFGDTCDLLAQFLLDKDLNYFVFMVHTEMAYLKICNLIHGY